MSEIREIINVELIKDYIKSNGILVGDFCKNSGVKYNTLRKILSHDIDVSINDIAKIAFYMNMEIKDILYKS